MTNTGNLIADQVPYIIETLMSLGASNVHVVPAYTKKGRQEYIFFIDLENGYLQKVTEFMAAEAGTIGLRVLQEDHIAFDYEMRDVRLSVSEKDKEWTGRIRVKLVMGRDGEFLSARAEFEDVVEALKSLKSEGITFTFYELKELVEAKAVQDMRGRDVRFEE
jgi:uncharacterized protein (DUF111 family)